MTQTLDYSGVKIIATADDGTETDVTALCTFDPPEGSDVPDVPGPVHVTATYEEDGEVFKTSFDVTVRRIVEVAVTAEPTKKSYVVGETIDMTGLAVTATCSDGTTLDVTADCTTAPADGDTVQTAGAIITEVFYKGLLVGQFEMTAREIIAGGEWWTLYGDGELVIFCEGNMPNYHTASAVPWYNYKSSITTATLESGVSSVGVRAFIDCAELTSVTMPDGVKAIQDFAFLNCTSLTSVTIPNSVTYFGNGAFEVCTSLTSIEIPEGVIAVSRSFCFACTSLTSVTIPNSVRTIAEHAFSNCLSLTSVTIPNSVTYIDDKVFLNCTSLTSIEIPEGVTEIRTEVFYGCANLSSVSIPSSVTSIGNSAFFKCNNLNDVYYSGTQTQWSQISIDRYNTPLTSATIHYNSSGPT